LHSNQLRSSEDDIMVVMSALRLPSATLGMLDCQCQVVVCSAEKDTGWLLKSGSKRVVEGKIGSAADDDAPLDTLRLRACVVAALDTRPELGALLLGDGSGLGEHSSPKRPEGVHSMW
jgi:hypothetical protein